MEFIDFPMSFSPAQSNEFDDLFKGECVDYEEISNFNPDEFLNLEEFQMKSANEIKQELSSSPQYTAQQLTPPISPQPLVIDSRQFRIIPIATIPRNIQCRPDEPAAAKRIKMIVPKPSSSSDSDTNTLNPSTKQKTSSSPVDKELIKRQRLIKNRESAILSRKKQKEYVQTLETKNVELLKENSFLKAENSQLKARLKTYTFLTCRCASTITTKLPSRNATLMLAVLFMVGFNVVPFGNFIYSTRKSGEMVSPREFTSRHLLFVENSTSVNATDASDPEELYFNQTDHIRKVNIENIRRWIPEPDLFNVSYLKKDFEFSHDPLQEKLAKMFEKSREQKKKRVTKKKAMIGPVQLYKKDFKNKNLYDSNLNIIKLNEFFEEINRKDDTFYVFSFKADHLLLPAIDSNYNFSQIKMNLIMPRNNDSLSSDKITMFQIETIILNTSLIQIAEKSIPENFLKSTPMNSTTCNDSPLNSSEKIKANFNDTTTPDFQQLKTAKFPSYFNRLDLLKDNSKK